jgi:uncharacterized protein YbaR (Trm112 family)/SAM-dependent methyltransferase
MHSRDLDILQCPYCGGSLQLETEPAPERREEEIINGLLGCYCAKYLVVDGVPVMLAGYGGNAGLLKLLSEDPAGALRLMLELDEERGLGFEKLLAKGDSATFGECLELFCPGNEGPYFVNRFSNPTYLAGQTILWAVGGDGQCFDRRAIDLGGGAGHLARALGEISGGAEIWLAETQFWKLWLARRFVAPHAKFVCCDAEAPLPFAMGSFSLTVCSDAFHYIWSKRQFAAEMTRLLDDSGMVVVSHMHNALQKNHSTGLPLPPAGWRGLFPSLETRVFKESDALDAVLERGELDLSVRRTDDDLVEEQALFLIASRRENVFRRYAFPGGQFMTGEWKINPLYAVETEGENVALRLRFPSESYEDEYKICKRYMPAAVEMTGAELRSLATGHLDDVRLKDLAEHYVVINAPKGYL